MTKIKNAHTCGMEPKDYTEFNSWIEYWTSKKDGYRYLLRPQNEIYRYQCSKCKKLFSWKEFDGAHVMKVDLNDRKKYLYPLCQTCNRGHDETPFEAFDALLLDIPPKRTN